MHKFRFNRFVKVVPRRLKAHNDQIELRRKSCLMGSNFVDRVKKTLKVRFITPFQEKWYGRYQGVYNNEMTFSEAIRCYPDPNCLHAYMHHYFQHRCPQIVRDHREYFKRDKRGFGEDAFHAMWWLHLLEYKPVQMLEMGVYRGQVILLWALINKYLHRSCEVHGISPFSPLGDAVSSYRKDLDYMADVLKNFDYWKLRSPVLVKALSTDPEAVAHIQSQPWDLIYIDGSHEYEIVLKDYGLCLENLRAGGILVLDDASLNTDYKPPSFSFAGHPGPSRVAREYADKEMEFLGAVGHNNVYKKKSAEISSIGGGVL